jgi:HTH-type transcriptional regulator, sugar sensing transcriptional regulator
MESLVGLGFTRLEAAVYVFLLKHGPATGYQVAKSINKPNSNTYQALEALALRGFLEVEEGKRRLFRAVPYREVLGQLEATFQERRDAAARDLASIPPARSDYQVYTIRTVSQSLERCRAMLSEARTKVLIDVFPGIVHHIRDDLAACAARGVDVTAKVYEKIEIPGARIVIDSRGNDVPQNWGIQWLNLIVDGKEHMYACLDATGRRVIHAIWNQGPYLAFLFHSGLLAEIVVDSILDRSRNTPFLSDVEQSIHDYGFYDWDDLPGYQLIQAACKADDVQDQSV